MMTAPPVPPPGPLLGLSVCDDANARYRLSTPLRAIPGGSWATYATVTHDQLRCADTVILSRLCGPVEQVQRILTDLRTRWGIGRILLDYDDAWFAPIPVRGIKPRKVTLDGVRYALRQCDGVIVTNQACAEHFSRYTDAPIATLPNLIWPNDWPAPPAPDSPPVVLIAGSPSHRDDWEMVAPALVELRRQLPQVRLRVLGCPHPTIMRIRSEGQEWTHDLATYIQRIQGASIALCPLRDTVFNRCKGNAKVAEYSLSAGCAVIGSPTQYADLLADGRGIVVPDDDPWGWAAAIDTYLANPARRVADAARLHIFVRSQFDVRDHDMPAIYTREDTSCHYSLMARTA